MPAIPVHIAQLKLGFTDTPQSQAQPRYTDLPTTSPGPFQEGAQGIITAGKKLGYVGRLLAYKEENDQLVKDSVIVEQGTQTVLQRYDEAEFADKEAQQTQLQYPQGPDPVTTDPLAPEPVPWYRPEERGTRLLQRGKEIIADVGHGMTPRQRAMFEATANRYLTARIRGVREQAHADFRDQARRSLSGSIDFHLQRAAVADDSVQAGLHLVNVRRLYGEAVQTGLLTQPEADALLQQKQTAFLSERAKVAIAANPQGSYRAIEQILQGEDPGPGFEDLVNAPRSELPGLRDTARTAWTQKVSEADRQEQLADRVGKSLQSRRYIALRSQASSLTPTLENLPKLEALQREAHGMANEGRLDKNDFDQLDTLLTAAIRKAQEDPVEKDDRDMLDVFTTRIYLADSEQELLRTQRALTEYSRSFTTETYTRLMNKVAERLGATGHYTKRPSYQDGLEVLKRLRDLAVLGDKEKERAFALAVEAYDERMAQLYAVDPRQMDREARLTAHELAGVYFPPDKQLSENDLPIPLRGLKTLDEVQQKLKEMGARGVGPAQRKRYRDLWERLHPQKGPELPTQDGKPGYYLPSNEIRPEHPDTLLNPNPRLRTLP